MGIIELLFTAVGLAMDAFAVAICKGLATDKIKIRHYLITGAWFGGFQALMPLIGYVLGSTFEPYIKNFDHWVAFILLAAIGANMIKEGFSKEEDSVDASFGFKSMSVMAIATSIDALAVGITLAVASSGISIWISVLLIGLITFVISAFGLKIGNIFGTRFKSKAETAGGIILILIGVKILLSHLGVLNF